jgi:hypothetical protein
LASSFVTEHLPSALHTKLGDAGCLSYVGKEGFGRELEELRRQYQEKVFAACGHTRGQELLRRLAYSVK